MTINEQAVAQHYGGDGLLDRILNALKASGADPGDLKPDDLKLIEEFHIGGREATVYATQKMQLSPDDHVLDIGCGIGGAARYLANAIGCRVSGIDLTPEFIETGRALNQLLGGFEGVRLEIASAVDLPFERGTFDAGLTMHVAMNIADRPKLYAETARVLKPGAIFAIYDVMKKGDAPLEFPVPWSETPNTSHLTTPDEMEALLMDAGFEILGVEDRTEFAREIIKKAMALAAKSAQPTGVHAIMGKSGAEKVKNLRGNVERGVIAPVLMITRRR